MGIMYLSGDGLADHTLRYLIGISIFFKPQSLDVGMSGDPLRLGGRFDFFDLRLGRGVP